LADPQKENGYTPIANEILEAIAKVKLSPTQYRIIFIVWRYTYGFNRKEHDLSLGFLSEATGCDKRQLQRELKELVKMNIVKQKIKNGICRKLGFNKHYDTWGGKTDIGEVTIGGIDNGETINTAIGETVKGAIGEIDNQEIHNLNTNLKKNIYTPEFEKFYKEYSNPQDKQRSFKNWKKQLKNNSVERLMQAAANYKKLVEHENRERQYIKSSANFLGQENFYKDYLPENFAGLPQQKPGQAKPQQKPVSNFTGRQYDAKSLEKQLLERSRNDGL
jgi:phage replication O-like protein O